MHWDSSGQPFDLPRAEGRGNVLLLAAPGRPLETVRRALDHCGLGVMIADDLAHLVKVVSDRKPHLVVLDRPVLAGPLDEVRRHIDRAKTTETLPVLLLTEDAQPSPDFVRLRPDAGFAEAFLVIRATLRRERPVALRGIRAASRFELDESKFQISMGGRSAALTKSDLCLIGPFFDAPHAVFERLLLERLAFNTDHYRTGNRLVDFYLSRTRRSLKEVLGADPIRSVRGQGYALAH